MYEVSRKLLERASALLRRSAGRDQETLYCAIDEWLENAGWISVEDRLPPPDLVVLVARHYGTVVSMDARRKRGKNGGWLRNDAGSETITHWMPLPEAPNRKISGR